MNVPNLKSARLVNKEWKEEADSEIARRGCFRLKFDPKSRPFHEGLEQLKFSTNLRCFDFHLQVSWDIEVKEVKLFLSLFGSHVKSLTLKSLINENSLSKLLDKLPNLENLFLSNKFLDNGSFFHAPTRKLKIKGDLNKLKHLTCLSDRNKRIYTIESGSEMFQIIEKAPNLVSINNAVFSSTYLKANASKWKGKVHLIKSFDFPDDDDDIESYTNSGFKVENLFILWNVSMELQESIRNIVKSSQDTLTTLVVVSKFICLPQETGFGPRFLPFQNLSVLQIWIDEFMWNNIVNDNFESLHLTQFRQEVFPNLTTVILELPSSRYFTQSTRGLEYSPFANAIESVLNLELRARGDGSDYWKIDEARMLRIKELFPKVKHLKLRDSFKIPVILPLCCAHWPELESLEFHINFMRRTDMKKPSSSFYFTAMKLYQNLDVALTGLPLEMCERLRAAKPEKMLEKDIKEAQEINSKQRSRNSLVFLTELKLLTVVFSDIRPRISRIECPISSVSCLYAFKLMPNLKVTLLYDQNLAKFNPETRTFQDQYKMEKYLDELSPHCEIGHWKNGGVASLISSERSFGPRMQARF